MSERRTGEAARQFRNRLKIPVTLESITGRIKDQLNIQCRVKEWHIFLSLSTLSSVFDGFVFFLYLSNTNLKILCSVIGYCTKTNTLLSSCYLPGSVSFVCFRPVFQIISSNETDNSCFFVFVLSSLISIFACFSRALDKREYLMIIFLFVIKTICCDP